MLLERNQDNFGGINIKMKRQYQMIIGALFFVVILGIGLLGISLLRRTKADQTMENLRENYVQTKDNESSDGEEGGEESIDFSALKEINSDIYAWIMVDGTDISYPVLQYQNSEDPYDDYYLEHNLDGSTGYPGVIYSEGVNLRDFSDNLTVLYGHNMKNKTMFSQLHYFEDADFFAKNRFFVIYTPEQVYTYEVFAAVSFSDEHLVDAYGTQTDLSAFSEAIGAVPGNHVKEIEPHSGDRVVVLSTCYANDSTKRLLVCGKLVSVK